MLTRAAGDGAAISYARPLQEINESLDTLALLLAAVAALGVLGAATAGLLVSRAGLAPVDRLTGIAEQIARTGDLTVAIPADGNDEVARLGRAFNSMTSSLAHSLERQQRLVADAGHELRTPLTSLRANIDLLLRSETLNRPLPADRRHKLLTSIQAQLAELTSLVGDLLQLARPAESPGATGNVPVAGHDIVADAVARVRLRGPDVTINAQLSPWYVWHDATALARAVVNLLDNAVKFSPPESTVEVSLRGGELTVTDHGDGIAQADLPFVFDRFWRAPSARGMPGSGLGLAIVAQVAREAGGSVEIGTAPDTATAAVAVGALLAGPAAYAATALSEPLNGTFPSAGPAITAGGGRGGGGPRRFGPDGGGQPGDGRQLPGNQGPRNQGPRNQGPRNQGPGNPGPGGLPPGGAQQDGRPGNAPGGAGPGGGPGERGAGVDTAMIDYLLANRGDARWLVATVGSLPAAPIILATGGEPVMAMGGFNGNDPAPTTTQFQAYVASVELRFVLAGEGGRSPGPSSVISWVTTHCAPVDPADYGGTATQQALYDCRDAR